MLLGSPLVVRFSRSSPAGCPRRPLLLALMTVFTLGNVLCALAPGYWLLLGARLVIAGTHGLFFGVSLILATRLVPKGRQASAVSFVIAGINLANVLGVPIGTAIGNAYGWRATFWTIAVVGVGATFALAVLVPRTSAEERQNPSSLISEIRALGRQTVLLSYVMITLFMTASFAVYAYIVPLLLSVTGVSTATVPWLLFVAGVGGIGGNLIGGRLGDWRPMPALIAIFVLVLAIYLAMLVAVYDAAAMTVVFFLWWLIGFSFAAPAQARILKAAADAPNLASTLISTAFNVGIATGPWLGGIALNAGWGYARLPWISVGFVAATLAVAIVSMVLERRTAPALAAA
jgi:DHA1 family inner membrane transport protein